MKRYSFFIASCLLFIGCLACSSNDSLDSDPKVISYDLPVEVIINGYANDAMEPFISNDGQFLFFNDLNSGGNTRLHYATKVNANTFTYIGELDGANELNTTQLNAVPDMDAFNNFYWTSVRDYPNSLDNLHAGTFTNGQVENVHRVQGDFYVGQEGWLVMDHGISADGDYLYYNNARFDEALCGEAPCETFIGIARKTGNNSFVKTVDSDQVLEQINNQDYVYYAPFISEDNLEFYYTRFAKGTIDENTMVEICVAVRTDVMEAFSTPRVLFAASLGQGIIEAPCLTADKDQMYYHKKVNGLHKIYMRSRVLIP